MKTCLFSAPFHFIEGIRPSYDSVIPTEFKEIWKKEELVPNQDIIAWVMNPAQKFLIDDSILSLFPALRVLVTPSTGTNHIDAEACRRRGIAVYGLLHHRNSTDSICASSEFTFLLLLNSMRRLDIALGEVDSRRWRNREDSLRGWELNGKKIGLIGFGRNGRKMARYCQAFDCEVLYHDPYVQEKGWRSRSLSELFSECDAVCICCSLTPETTGMVTKNLLMKMKPGASLVNTSRGEIINEQDLSEVLNVRKDLKVCLDVLCGESTARHLESPLLEFHDRRQITVTPHMAGISLESQSKAARIALDILREHLNSSSAYAS